VVSATLVAMMRYVPAAAGAVYRPDASIVPPDADQVTPVLLLPLTVAVNCCVLPEVIDAEPGFTDTETPDAAAATDTVAVAVAVLSAALVAVTVYVPGVEGAA